MNNIINRVKNKIRSKIQILNIYKIDNPQTIEDFRVINSNFEIEFVNDSHMIILKEYAEKYRKKGYFENILSKRFDDPDHVGFVVIDREFNELAYICWLSMKHNKQIYKENKIILKEGEAFIIDAYCVPKYQRLGLHNRMMQERINYCAQKKCTAAYVTIYSSNYKAISNIEKFIFKLCYKSYKIFLTPKKVFQFTLKV